MRAHIDSVKLNCPNCKHTWEQPSPQHSRAALARVAQMRASMKPKKLKRKESPAHRRARLRKAAKLGGAARAAALTPKQRSAIARSGALAKKEAGNEG